MSLSRQRRNLGQSAKVKVSSNDSDSDYLEAKLVAGTNVTLTVQDDGAFETIEVSATGGGGGSPGADTTVTVNDTTPGGLSTKLVAGSGVTLETLNPGGNEQIEINAAAEIVPEDRDAATYAAPSTTQAEVPGTNTAGGAGNYEGILSDDFAESFASILIPTPSGADLALLDDGGGNYLISFEDDGFTDPNTPDITTGEPGLGLTFRFDFFHPDATPNTLIAELNAWGLANLSTTPATIATFAPSANYIDGTEEFSQYGIMNAQALLSVGLSSVLRVEFTSPTAEDIYDFNSVPNELNPDTSGFLYTRSFALGVRANASDPSQLPAGSTVEIHKYVSGGPKIRGVQYGNVGMLCLCGPSATMGDLVTALEAAAPNATVTRLTGVDGDLCSAVFETVSEVAVEILALGAHAGAFTDFSDNGGVRWRRWAPAAGGGFVTVFPPSTYLRT